MPLRVSSTLDLHDVLWLKVARVGDSGREGSWEQHPLEDIQRQIRGGARRTVPLGGVLRLSAAAVPPHFDAVTEVRHSGGCLWLEAREDGPGPGGWGWRLPGGGAPILLRASWLVLALFWIGAVLS